MVVVQDATQPFSALDGIVHIGFVDQLIVEPLVIARLRLTTFCTRIGPELPGWEC
jgi:hypothetical protein